MWGLIFRRPVNRADYPAHYLRSMGRYLALGLIAPADCWIGPHAVTPVDAQRLVHRLADSDGQCNLARLPRQRHSSRTGAPVSTMIGDIAGRHSAFR